MLNESDIKKIMAIGVVCFAITVIVNLVCYGKLPDQMPLKTNGATVAKNIFVVIFPALILVLTGLNIKLNNRSAMNAILVNIILMIVNIGMVISKIL